MSDEQKEAAQTVNPDSGDTPGQRLISSGGRWLNSRPAGLLLIVLGVVLLVGRLFGFPVGHYLWPSIILVPGVILLALAFNMEGQMGEPFSILGSIITMLGLMFFAMSITGLWASWAYAWALLFPTSIGVGQILHGIHTRQEHLVKTGKSLVIIGLSIFGFGFLFFEAILHINHLKALDLCLPAGLIFLGAVMLWRAMKAPRK